MKKSILSLILIMFASLLMAQGTEQFPLGSKQLNFGPLYAGIDFGVQENITVGPMVEYNWAYYNSNTREFISSFDIMGKADYHFGTLLQLPQEWDVYGGLRVGMGFGTATRFMSGIEIGGRWFWNKKWGLNIESVYGNYWAGNIGVTMKL